MSDDTPDYRYDHNLYKRVSAQTMIELLPAWLVRKLVEGSPHYTARELFAWLNRHPELLPVMVPQALSTYMTTAVDVEPDDE